jgi:hypothetical protein
MLKVIRIFAAVISLAVLPAIAVAQDIDGVVEHPMIERYPGQVIAWQHIENYQPYKVAVGPVTGYRQMAIGSKLRAASPGPSTNMKARTGPIRRSTGTISTR